MISPGQLLPHSPHSLFLSNGNHLVMILKLFLNGVIVVSTSHCLVSVMCDLMSWSRLLCAVEWVLVASSLIFKFVLELLFTSVEDM